MTKPYISVILPQFCRFYVGPFWILHVEGENGALQLLLPIYIFYDYSYINLERLFLWLTLKLIYHIIAVEPEEEKSNAGAVAAGVF